MAKKISEMRVGSAVELNDIVPILDVSESNADKNTQVTVQQLTSHKANINSPSFTGIPTAPSAISGSNNQIATIGDVRTISVGKEGDEYIEGTKTFANDIYTDGTIVADSGISATKLQGVQISSSTPNDNQVLTFSGGLWQPSNFVNNSSSINNDILYHLKTSYQQMPLGQGVNHYLRLEWEDTVYDNLSNLATFNYGVFSPIQSGVYKFTVNIKANTNGLTNSTTRVQSSLYITDSSSVYSTFSQGYLIDNNTSIQAGEPISLAGVVYLPLLSNTQVSIHLNVYAEPSNSGDFYCQYGMIHIEKTNMPFSFSGSGGS